MQPCLHMPPGRSPLASIHKALQQLVVPLRPLPNNLPFTYYPSPDRHRVFLFYFDLPGSHTRPLLVTASGFVDLFLNRNGMGNPNWEYSQPLIQYYPPANFIRLEHAPPGRWVLKACQRPEFGTSGGTILQQTLNY